jgi:hypothetical protein
MTSTHTTHFYMTKAEIFFVYVNLSFLCDSEKNINYSLYTRSYLQYRDAMFLLPSKNCMFIYYLD